MKLVFVAFDSVSHQPKSTNMISMTQKHNFKIDSLYVDDINTLNDIYDTYYNKTYGDNTNVEEHAVPSYWQATCDSLSCGIYTFENGKA